ncbi:hypothetical protein ACWGI9_43395 [Streptomyces sp. NPDC054833]
MDVAARCPGKAGRERERRGLHRIDTGDNDVYLYEPQPSAAVT